MRARSPGSRIAAARLALACALLSLSSAARASDDYPAVIQSELALSARPACTLCHGDLNGGTGTVVTPFGLSMQDFGARGKDPASLRRAVQSDRDNDVDSDGDDIADTAELTFGSDPNDGPGRVNAVTRPQHGCALAAADNRAVPRTAAWTIALCFGLGLIARRRRAAHRLSVTSHQTACSK